MRTHSCYYERYYTPREKGEIPACPICRSIMYDTIYKDFNDEICGCSDCVTALDLEEYLDELDEAYEEAMLNDEEMRFFDAE